MLHVQVTALRLIKEMHPQGEPEPLPRSWIAGRTQLLVMALNDELRGFMANRVLSVFTCALAQHFDDH